MDEATSGLHGGVTNKSFTPEEYECGRDRWGSE